MLHLKFKDKNSMISRHFCLSIPFILLAAVGFLCPLPSRGDSQPALELSNDAVQLKVPFERQEDPKACGLAVLKMISGYYGKKLNQAQVDWIRTNSQAGEGVMASELVTVFGAAEFDTALFQGTMDNQPTGLFYHLDKKRPLVVMITSKDGKSSHYDVVTGYDPLKSRLLILDPATGPVTAVLKDFNEAWKRAHCFTLVAVPKALMQKTPAPKK